MRSQVEEDAFQAWVNAANCLIYEGDPGPARLNVGSATEPRLVPRSEAWQHAYAMRVLVSCGGDYARLTAAAQQCRDDVSRKNVAGAKRGRELLRAADLCDQAARMAKQAGAVDDDKARRRLVAACEHEGMVIALGSVPGVTESSTEDLIQTLREIDDDEEA